MFLGFYRGKQAHPGDLHTVLGRAANAGIDRIMITSGTLSDVDESIEIIKEYSGCGIALSTTVGVHPTRCLELESDPSIFERLKISLDKNAKYINALGEFGLDYDRLEFCPKEIQLKWFRKQFELASTSLPLFLHMRNCCNDFIQVIKEYRLTFTHGVVHSFTGSTDDVKAILAEDLFIGLNGCSLRTEESLHVVKGIPLDRIMIESDAPWCDIRKTHPSYPLVKTHLLQVDKSKHSLEAGVKSRNEPLATRQVLEVIAALHEIPLEEAAETIYETTCKVFSK